MPESRSGYLKKRCTIFTLSAQQVPYSATVPGHLFRLGNGHEMLVKDSPCSLVVRSQILQKILRHAVYRDLMNKGSLPRGFIEHRLNFVEKKVQVLNKEVSFLEV